MDGAIIRKLLRSYAMRLAAAVTGQRAKLSPESMIRGYRSGRFPMPGRLDLISWQDPQTRAVIPLDERFRVGKRLARKIQSGHFTVTFDQAFPETIASCAAPRPGRKQTWLTPDLIRAYIELHRRGCAHSVEVWRAGRLVGGEYGVAIGGYYSGESMFTREDYAGRVALVALVNRLRERGFIILDVQQMSPLTAEFGGYEITRAEFRALHADAIARRICF